MKGRRAFKITALALGRQKSRSYGSVPLDFHRCDFQICKYCQPRDKISIIHRQNYQHAIKANQSESKRIKVQTLQRLHHQSKPWASAIQFIASSHLIWFQYQSWHYKMFLSVCLSVSLLLKMECRFRKETQRYNEKDWERYMEDAKN